MYGLYGLKHHKVEKSLDVTIVMDNDGQRNLKIELEFCEAEFAMTEDQIRVQINIQM